MKRWLYILFFFPVLAFGQINADGVISMGRNALYYEDYVLSIQYFNQVIEAKPYLYEPYFYRAVAKYYLGDYLGAVNDCSASIERDPFIDNSFQLRAISRVMIGEYKEAAEDYRLLIQRQHDNKDVWYNLVLCESQQKNLDSADKLLDTMILKWPKYARCYMLKAQVALERKDTILADTCINRTLQIDSFDVDALSAKAMLYLKRREFKQSEEYYDKAIIQSPRQASFFLGRAIARYEQTLLRGAMDDYNITIEIDPDNYPAHYNRGLLRMQVGENNLAIEDFDFVLQKEPRDRLALFNRAQLLELTGDYRAAIEDYTTVLEDYPNFITGYENRARCRRKVGDNAGATADERKVVVAQLDDMYGSKKRPERTTRKQKEKNIDEYQNLVVEDGSDDVVKFYSSDYRGRVQNREVPVQPEPIYVLTFNNMNIDVLSRKHVALFLDAINDEKVFSRPLYLTTREPAISSSQIKELDFEESRISKQIGQGKATVKQLFAQAMLASVKRDYSSALSILEQTLHLNPTDEGALFLRVAVRLRQIETQAPVEKVEASKPSDATQIVYQSILDDLDKAISIDNQCAYLYYNRGCINYKMKRLSEAILDFNKAMELNPDLAEAYYNRGLIYIEMKDYQKGFSDLGKAGELGLYSAYSLIKHFRKQQQRKK